MIFRGKSASPGIAIGKALIYKAQGLNVERKHTEDIEAEQKKLQSAISATQLQLKIIKDETEKRLGFNKAAIFEVQSMVLEDPELIKQIENKIQEEKVQVAYAVNEVINSFTSVFEGIEDEYMQERAADIRDVGTRLLKNLMGIKIVNLATLSEEVVVVAHDITPSDTAAMNSEKVLGFITDIGGRTSHTAIMARSLEIPAIVGLNNISKKVKNGDIIAFDGEEGIGYINPNIEQLEIFEKKKRDYEDRRRKLLALKAEATITKDHKRIELAANIGTPKDVKAVLENGGEGIGLFRTEFLYMNRNHLPAEEEQFQAYREVLEKMEGKPVVIRTLDIGGDKELPYLTLPKEANPSLGYRAIRICLDRPEILKTQLRALLRASIYGNLKIMFPMISSVEEVRAVGKILDGVKRELNHEGIIYHDKIEIGIMIEIPSAAIIGDLLIKEVDFFSIGTNDLIQYTIAADRMNEKIANLYDPFQPAILRIIKMIIEHAHNAGKWVSMCGEMAGDTKFLPLLLGLGLDKLSMNPISILPVRSTIAKLSYQKMKKMEEAVLNLSTAEDVRKYMDNYI